MSQREISEWANVSKVTARTATKRLEQEGLLVSSPGQGTFVRCLPGSPEGGGLPIEVKRIGVVLSRWDENDRFSWENEDLFSGLFGLVRASDYQYLFMSYSQWQAIGDVEKLISNNQLDFLIWMDLSPSEIASVARLEERRFPQLLVQRFYKGVRCSAVLQDNAGAVEHMVSSLSDEQLRSCVVVAGEPDINPYDERLSAFRSALSQRLGNDAEATVLQVPELPQPRWAFEAVFREMFSRWKPKAILNFAGYCGELQAAAVDGGIQIGVDCELLTFNVPEEVKKVMSADYTLYDFDFREMGRVVFRTVDRMMKNPADGPLIERVPFQVVRQEAKRPG
jgi:DNA-binding LacI/PurR family transcriptional regulator